MTTLTLDPVGRWFQARVNNGVDDDINLAVVDGAGQLARRWKLAHRLHDGRGALRTLLAHTGLEGQEPPLSSRMTRPSFASLLAGRPWRKDPAAGTPAWRDLHSIEAAPAPVAHRLLPPDSLPLLERWAARQGVSLTAVLLWAEHRAVMNTLCHTDAGGSWFVPVDMRPAVADSNGNCSAGVYLHLPPGCEPSDVHARLSHALRSGQHWWNWYQAVLVSRLGQRTLDWLYPRLCTPGRYIGSFSMLGHWRVRPCESFGRDYSLLACGPGSPAYPVANGVTLTNGRMVLALRVHPVCDARRRAAEDTLDSWVAVLGQLCSDARRMEGLHHEAG